MDKGVWQAIVRGVTKTWTQLSTHAHNVFNLHYHCFICQNANTATVLLTKL